MHVVIVRWNMCVFITRVLIYNDMPIDNVYSIMYHLCKAKITHPKKRQHHPLGIEGGIYQSIVSENLCVVWQGNYSWNLALGGMYAHTHMKHSNLMHKFPFSSIS